MTQQLATATKNNQSWPLDYGTMSADADGFLIVTRGTRIMSYAPDYKLSDIAISNVADDYELPSPPPVVDAQHPYKDYVELRADQFWGLVTRVYMALQGSAGAGLDRVSRLLMSKRTQPIIKLIDSLSIINADDKEGNFLEMYGILTTTNHETDGHLLMEIAEASAIMTTWKNL